MTRGMRWDIEDEIKSVFDCIWSRLTAIVDMCGDDNMTKDDIKDWVESLIDEIGD